jgi:hypothetical protein
VFLECHRSPWFWLHQGFKQQDEENPLLPFKWPPHFLSNLIGQNVVMWPHSAAREAGKCSFASSELWTECQDPRGVSNSNLNERKRKKHLNETWGRDRIQGGGPGRKAVGPQTLEMKVSSRPRALRQSCNPWWLLGALARARR